MTKLNMKNKMISLVYDESMAVMTFPMNVDSNTWNDITGILTKISGENMTKRLMFELVTSLSTIISTGNDVVKNINFTGTNSTVRLSVTKQIIQIKFMNFSIKPHIA